MAAEIELRGHLPCETLSTICSSSDSALDPEFLSPPSSPESTSRRPLHRSDAASPGTFVLGYVTARMSHPGPRNHPYARPFPPKHKLGSSSTSAVRAHIFRQFVVFFPQCVSLSVVVAGVNLREEAALLEDMHSTQVSDV